MRLGPGACPTAGYFGDDLRRGLWPAVEEFLASHRGVWDLWEQRPNNNGLTVMRRIGPNPTTVSVHHPRTISPSPLLLLLLLLVLLLVIQKR